MPMRFCSLLDAQRARSWSGSRFWPEYVELHRRVATRELGRPLAMSTSRLSPPADWNKWMADPSQSGGVSVDLMIHDFDPMNWLLGLPRSVYASEPSPGHLQALVEYDGATAVGEASMRMPHSYAFSSSIRVLAEQGAIEHTFTAAPAHGEGNIGAAQGRSGLWLYSEEQDLRRLDWKAAIFGRRRSRNSSPASRKVVGPCRAPASRRGSHLPYRSRRIGQS
jgi:predicted dehydrogenase